MSSEKTTWDGKERRNEDVKVGIASLAIKTRAAKERLNANQMFEQHEDPAQNHVRPEDLENSKLRSKVKALLRTAVDDVEIAKYINGLVNTQYEGSLDTLKTFNLYNPEQPQEGDVPAPTLEQAKEILTNQITPEQLEVIKNMEVPTLQLIPITSINRYVKALDSHKPMDNQNNVLISDWHRGAFKRADKRNGITDNTITDWTIAITEGAKEPKLLKGDDGIGTLRERNAWFKRKFERKDVSGVDLKRMLALMMDSLKKRKLINDYCSIYDGTWTFVNEEGEKNGFFSSVSWDDYYRRVILGERKDFCQLILNVDCAVGRYSYARFRTSVMVDVPKPSSPPR